EDLLRTLASNCRFETWPPGVKVVTQHQDGNSMYIIRSGEMAVTSHESMEFVW
ncbi:hypothetical protein T484DRAFT_1769100, partial [Baffinella frigidus]